MSRINSARQGGSARSGFGSGMGYPWPASALTNTEMAVLVDVRAQTGKPISVLLKEAVQLAYGGCSSIVEEVAQERCVRAGREPQGAKSPARRCSAHSSRLRSSTAAASVRTETKGLRQEVGGGDLA